MLNETGNVTLEGGQAAEARRVLARWQLLIDLHRRLTEAVARTAMDRETVVFRESLLAHRGPLLAGAVAVTFAALLVVVAVVTGAPPDPFGWAIAGLGAVAVLIATAGLSLRAEWRAMDRARATPCPAPFVGICARCHGAVELSSRRAPPRCIACGAAFGAAALDEALGRATAALDAAERDEAEAAHDWIVDDLRRHGLARRLEEWIVSLLGRDWGHDSLVEADSQLPGALLVDDPRAAAAWLLAHWTSPLPVPLRRNLRRARVLELEHHGQPALLVLQPVWPIVSSFIGAYRIELFVACTTPRNFRPQPVDLEMARVIGFYATLGHAGVHLVREEREPVRPTAELITALCEHALLIERQAVDALADEKPLVGEPPPSDGAPALPPPGLAGIPRPKVRANALSCSNCGAPVTDSRALYQCRYCGKLADTPPPQANPSGLSKESPSGEADLFETAGRLLDAHIQERHMRFRPVAGLLFVLYFLGMLLVALVEPVSNLIRSWAHRPPTAETAPSSYSGPRWDPSVPPLLGVFGGGGDDILGVLRTGEHSYVLEAIHGTTLERIWRTKELDQAQRDGLRVAYTSGYVVAVTGLGSAVVYRATTGKRIAGYTLGSPAVDACTSPEGPADVFFEVASGAMVVIEAAGGEAAFVASRPPWCPGLDASCGGVRRHARCVGLDEITAPLSRALDEVRLQLVLQEGALSVGLGAEEHTLDTRPVAVGLDLAGGRVLWKRVVAYPRRKEAAFAAADLVDGRLVAFPDSDDARLLGVDAASGRVLYDVAAGRVPPKQAAFSPGRVAFLAELETTRLLVRDARTGVEVLP